jgi:perosamine synthetase
VTVVGIIPVHVGGYMMDQAAVEDFARRFGLWVVEDAAHAFPRPCRASPGPAVEAMRRGDRGRHLLLRSTRTRRSRTGEGGMAVTDDAALAERMRLMSLHGLSHDAWDRYSGGRAWDYRIIAPGYKYNMTDMAAASRPGAARAGRGDAPGPGGDRARYLSELSGLEELELPPERRAALPFLAPLPVR